MIWGNLIRWSFHRVSSPPIALYWTLTFHENTTYWTGVAICRSVIKQNAQICMAISTDKCYWYTDNFHVSISSSMHSYSERTYSLYADLIVISMGSLLILYSHKYCVITNEPVQLTLYFLLTVAWNNTTYFTFKYNAKNEYLHFI